MTVSRGLHHTVLQGDELVVDDVVNEFADVHQEALASHGNLTVLVLVQGLRGRGKVICSKFLLLSKI